MKIQCNAGPKLTAAFKVATKRTKAVNASDGLRKLLAKALGFKADPDGTKPLKPRKAKAKVKRRPAKKAKPTKKVRKR